MHVNLYGHVCRVCMCKRDNLHNLNEIIEEYSLSMLEMLVKILGRIQKHATEFPLPEEICEGCMDQLQIAYRFQEMCLTTKERMYKIWKESQTKSIIDEMAEEEEMKQKDEVELDPIKVEQQDMNFSGNGKIEDNLLDESNMPLNEKDFGGTEGNYGDINKKGPHDGIANQYEKLSVDGEESSDEFEEDENIPLSSLWKNENTVKDEYNPKSGAERTERNDEEVIHLKTVDVVNENTSNHCSSCNKFFKYTHHLAKHRCKQTAAQKCEICSKVFSNANMLQKHKRNKHKDGPCKTKMKKSKMTASQGLEDNTAAQQHDIEMNDMGDNNYLLTEDEENNDADYIAVDKPAADCIPPDTNDYACNQCNAAFRFEKQLERHLKKHTEAHRFVCLICSDRFKYPFMLHKHVEKHHPEENSKAPKDSGGTENKKDNLEKSQICKYCPSAYTNIGGLAQHMSKKHPDIVPFKCDKCNKTFVVEEHLKIHTNRHMGIKNFKCELCEKSFSFKFAMKQHMRIHTGDLNYLCTLCGKKFYRPSNLRQHMQRHGDDKPYTCPHCPKRFKCPSDRYIHLMSHQEGKNHVCSTCGARFSRVDTLHQHQVLHTGQKPYKCDQCPMAFPRLMNLNRHLRTHTGEKPYKCKYCDKAYAQSNDLNKHMRTHLGENTYMCSQCPAAFKYQADLRNHEWEHYRKQKEEEESRTTKSEAIMSEIELKTSTLMDEAVQ